jgi:CheY-like chemotaxis protein
MIRTVISVVDDMFFVSKIRATGKALGLIAKFPRTLEAFRDIINDEAPNLILVDLHNSKVDPIALAKELKADATFRRIPLLGFYSHVQMDLQRQAQEAGYDEVLPRSLFARDLAHILAGQIKGQEKI